MKIKILGLLVIICSILVMIPNQVFAGDASGTISVGVDTGLQGIVKTAPTPAPLPQTYSAAQSVTLASPGSSAIYYTLDGTVPGNNSILYTGIISVSVSTVIRCVAYYADGSSGPQGSYNYLITPPGGGSAVINVPATTTTPTTTATTTPTTTPTTTTTTTPTLTPTLTTTPKLTPTSTPTPATTPTLTPTPTPTPVIFSQQGTTGTNLVTQSNVTLNSQGISQTAGQIATADGNVSFNVAAGTQMLNAQGQPLTEMLVSIPTTVPPPPPGGTLVLSYDFGPSGATFAPPLTMTLKYDPATLPSGVSESTLYIAYWDGSQWQKLPSTIDTVTRTVTALVPHFTDFSIFGQTSVTTPTTAPTTLPGTTPITTPVTGLRGGLIAVIVVVVLIVIAIIVWLVAMRRIQN